MKKVIFLCLLLLITSIKASATNPEKDIDKTGTISGKVLDANLKQPLPYVNVIIKNTEGEILTGGITLEDGTFKIEKIKAGKAVLNIQYIGYKTFTKEINITKGNYKIKIGEIFLEEDLESLDEVTVIADVSSIQQKVDRKVITIGKDLAATGTASELMIGIPSVSVDAQSGEISLRGNQNVRVMVDGKLSNIPTAQLLKQIPSTAIKVVELITNPSAKYNPEGMSGIINIVLHKNTMIGFNGSISTSLAYEEKARFNSAINLNYRTGKFNVYTNYSNSIGKNFNNGHVTRPGNNSEQFFELLTNRKSHLFKVGVDVYLNEKNTLSLFTNQNIADNGMNSETRAIFNNDNAFNQRQLFFVNDENTSSQYNLDYKLDFNKEGHNIELEMDYNIFDQENPANYTILQGSQSSYKDFNDTDRKSTTVNIDYINPVTEASKLELGVQARLFNTDINYASTGESFNNAGVLGPTPGNSK